MKVNSGRQKTLFKAKASEKFQIFKQRMQVFWDRLVRKGHEKMTFMFIPHNEKKLISFQISKFILMFFVLLFVVIIVTSAYAVVKNNASKREEQRLMNDYNDIRSHLLRFEKLSSSIEDLMDDLKPDIEELYELAAGSGDVSKIWDINEDSLEPDDEAFIRNKPIMPADIFTLRDMQKDLIATTNTVRTIKNFVDVRNKVIQDTPSMVPNVGHITSLFGWRRSPFGFGKDFHTGIDIAAPSGTIIRATAPGTVVSSGWGGGYGNMVRIKHKYGFETIYGHCSSVAVSVGDSVRKGQIVAYIGQTGNATGNHCHYEIRLGGVAINPYPYMSRDW